MSRALHGPQILGPSPARDAQALAVSNSLSELPGRIRPEPDFFPPFSQNSLC